MIKCHAVYDEPFWRRDGLTGQAASDTGPAAVVFDNSPPDGSPGVLLAFLEGAAARELGTWPAADRRAAVLGTLTRLFGPRAATPVAFYERDWAAEEWSRGCYGAYLPPGAWTAFGARAAPADRPAALGRRGACGALERVHGGSRALGRRGRGDAPAQPHRLPRRRAGEVVDMTTIETKTRKLGGTEVFPIGLGAMPMALSGRPPEEQSIRAIHAALDAGVNLIDTADAYARDESEVGHNERLIAKALQGRYDDVIVATKAGHIRPGGAWELDGRPEHIRAACEASLKALGTDRIDLYQYHRPDPNVPYAETVGAFKELQDEGKVRWIGLSNCTVEQLEEALGVAEIVSVQNQLSLGYTGAARQGRGRRLHGARHRVPALVAARRDRQGRRHRRRRSGARRPPRATACRRSRSRWPGCSRSARP